MSHSKGEAASDFGRDEINALLGGGLSERLMRPVAGGSSSSKSGVQINRHTSSHRPHTRAADVSDLTVEETAALLLHEQKLKQKQGGGGGGTGISGGQHKTQRHRAATSHSNTTKHNTPYPKRKYHELLEEELQKQQQQQARYVDTKEQAPRVDSDRLAFKDKQEDNNDDDDDEFLLVARHRPRIKAAAAVLETAQLPPQERRPAENSRDDDNDNSTSSSSSSSSSSAPSPERRAQGRHRRRRAAAATGSDDDNNSSSSSDDSTREKRRARLVQQRRQRTVASVVAVAVAPTPEYSESTVNDNDTNKEIMVPHPQSVDEGNVESSVRTAYDQPKQQQHQPDATVKSKAGDDDDKKSEGTSSSDDSASSSSDDNDDDEKFPNRPVFVPKHKRGLAVTVKTEQIELERQAQKQIEMEARRKQESRAMVQQSITSAKQQHWTASDGGPIVGLLMTSDAAVTAAIPDDADVEHDSVARDEWQVRELERWLADWDLECERDENERERLRRRRMTDDDYIPKTADDSVERDNHQQPQRQGQRFYHRGAFYMDESEWGESDVRQKVNSYAQAVTGDDRRDRRQLPQVMQVKKFGFANQSKYKGLAAEDTTDKHMDMLPLPRKK